MNSLKTLIFRLKAYDIVVLVFYLFLNILNLIYRERIPEWSILFTINIFVIIAVFVIAYFNGKYDKKNKYWRRIHYWYIAPLIFFTFKELYFMIYPIRQQDFDYLFINIDRFIFGGDPTHFLYQFAHPLLTEILQIVYGLFYLLPVILAIAMLKKKRYVATDYVVFSIIYGFFLSYLGYFALPGVGPRFTLHKFEDTSKELPGLLFTEPLRELTNAGESIPAGTPNPREVVQRDVFPSGHTMLTLIVMFLSVKLKSRSRFFIVPVGTLLIFSTVYLRYHYVIDLVGGFAFMVLSLTSGKYLFNLWRSKTGEEIFEYENY